MDRGLNGNHDESFYLASSTFSVFALHEAIFIILSDYLP